MRQERVVRLADWDSAGQQAPSDVEKLARMEHDRWMAARREAGVTYGEQRTARTHPDMRDWDAGLTEDAKEKDRMFVRGLPALLEAEGLAIVRLPRSYHDD